MPVIHRAKKQRHRYRAKHRTKGCIALFIGCLGETFEQQTTEALIQLLTQLEYDVEVIPQQTCCGALSSHMGDEQHGIELAKQNIQAFMHKHYDAVLYSATGCGVQLLDYATLPWSNEADQKQAAHFVSLLEEVTHFLQRVPWPETISFSALDKQVAVHEPCSQRNVLRQKDSVSTLLQKIPDLKVSSLDNNDRCCGAAGTYMLTHETHAYALRQPKIDNATREMTDIVVTINPGCSLFLGAGLAAKKIRVVHPVVLLAEQLII